jgi:hypothetical protein
MGETETILKPETKTEKAVNSHGCYADYSCMP